jgi:hypothetical protein
MRDWFGTASILPLFVRGCGDLSTGYLFIHPELAAGVAMIRTGAVLRRWHRAVFWSSDHPCISSRGFTTGRAAFATLPVVLFLQRLKPADLWQPC